MCLGGVTAGGLAYVKTGSLPTPRSWYEGRHFSPFVWKYMNVSYLRQIQCINCDLKETVLEFLCLWRHWKTIPEICNQICPSVSECVSLCIQKTLWTAYLKNQWRELHEILATDVFGFIDILIRFSGQKVKGQSHSRRRHNHWRQPVECNLVLHN